MKIIKSILSLILATALTLTLLTGCQSSGGDSAKAPGQTSEVPAPGADSTVGSDQTDIGANSETEPGASITVTDMFDRVITLTEPATRIVALSAADCEILFALGAGDTLVGRGEYCDYPAQVLDVPSVESGAETNLEQIIALQPQVLLMSGMAQTPEQVEALEKAGIQVVVSYAQNIEGTYEAIAMIGKLMGKDAEAENLINEMKTTFADLAAKAAADTSEKTIYFEVSPLEYGLWAAGNNSYMNEIAELFGLTNIFSDVESWGAVSEETVLERNPDYILTVGMYFGEGPTPTEEILGRKGWENVTAVQNKAVLNLSNNELSRPTPRLMEGAQMLYDFVFGAD